MYLNDLGDVIAENAPKDTLDLQEFVVSSAKPLRDAWKTLKEPNPQSELYGRFTYYPKQSNNPFVEQNAAFVTVGHPKLHLQGDPRAGFMMDTLLRQEESDLNMEKNPFFLLQHKPLALLLNENPNAIIQQAKTLTEATKWITELNRVLGTSKESEKTIQAPEGGWFS